MSLLQYYKIKKPVLPNPNGPLARVVPSSSIVAANEVVKNVISEATAGTSEGLKGSLKERGPYVQFTPEEKARIGKRAAEYGVASTVRHFKRTFSDREVKESSVRTWRNKYLDELSKRKRAGEEMDVNELSDKKRGRRLMLGEELDKQVQSYVLDLRSNGAVINSSITIAVAQGIVTNYDSNLLSENGGHIALTKSWAKYLLRRLGFVKRRSSTKAKVSASNFASLQEQFSYDARVLIDMMEIPSSLVINWDQTGIQYVPVSQWTMEREGMKRIEITDNQDKHQITAVFVVTMNGNFWPPQLVYAGKTPKCLPKVDYCKDWDITYTEKHWCNEVVMIDYVNKFLLPYIRQKRQQLNLLYPSLVIFDLFKGQCTDQFLSLLKDNGIHILIVPANCTDRLQPLDISVNKTAKEFLRRQFQDWYAAKISDQMLKHGECLSVQPVDLCLAVVKPLGARWMMKFFDYMQQNPSILKNGFIRAGIVPGDSSC